jgi:hypothetical protein
MAGTMMGKTASAGVAATAAILATACAGSAAAQGLPPENVTEIGASLDVRHDSNVARSNAERAAARGLSRGDERATPSINLLYSRPLGRNRVSITASAGYDFYRRNKGLNRERLSFGGTGTAMVGPLTFDLGAELARRQTDPADLTPLLIPGNASIRNTQSTQDYNAKVRFGSQPYGIKPVASFGRSIGNNSSPRRRFADYRSTTYGGGVSYESPTIGYWDVQYLKSNIDYPNRPATIAQTGFTTDRVTLSGRRDLGAILVANGSVSWITLTPDQRGTGVERFRSVGYSLGLRAVPSPNLSLDGNFARDVSPSLGTDALYQVNNNYAVSGTYALSQDIAFSLSGAVAQRRFAGAGQVFGVALANSVQRSVTGSVDLARTRPLRVGIDVGYQKRDANGTFFDYDSFYAGIRTSFRLRR